MWDRPWTFGNKHSWIEGLVETHVSKLWVTTDTTGTSIARTASLLGRMQEGHPVYEEDTIWRSLYIQGSSPGDSWLGIQGVPEVERGETRTQVLVMCLWVNVGFAAGGVSLLTTVIVPLLLKRSPGGGYRSSKKGGIRGISCCHFCRNDEKVCEVTRRGTKLNECSPTHTETFSRWIHIRFPGAEPSAPLFVV